MSTQAQRANTAALWYATGVFSGGIMLAKLRAALTIIAEPTALNWKELSNIASPGGTDPQPVTWLNSHTQQMTQVLMSQIVGILTGFLCRTDDIDIRPLVEHHARALRSIVAGVEQYIRSNIRQRALYDCANDSQTYFCCAGSMPGDVLQIIGGYLSDIYRFPSMASTFDNAAGNLLYRGEQQLIDPEEHGINAHPCTDGYGGIICTRSRPSDPLDNSFTFSDINNKHDYLVPHTSSHGALIYSVGLPLSDTHVVGCRLFRDGIIGRRTCVWRFDIFRRHTQIRYSSTYGIGSAESAEIVSAHDGSLYVLTQQGGPGTWASVVRIRPWGDDTCGCGGIISQVMCPAYAGAQLHCAMADRVVLSLERNAARIVTQLDTVGQAGMPKEIIFVSGDGRVCFDGDGNVISVQAHSCVKGYTTYNVQISSLIGQPPRCSSFELAPYEVTTDFGMDADGRLVVFVRRYSPATPTGLFARILEFTK